MRPIGTGWFHLVVRNRSSILLIVDFASTFLSIFKCNGWKSKNCDETVIGNIKGSAHICGGSLIFDGQYVLTAAHCVDASSTVTKVAEWFVQDMEVLYGSTNLANADAVEVAMIVQRQFIHLLRLNPSSFTQTIEPIPWSTILL